MQEAIESCNLEFFYGENGIDLPEIGSHCGCEEIHGLHEMECDDEDAIEQFLNHLFPDGSRPECEHLSEFDQWFHSRYDEETREVKQIEIISK